MPKQILFAHSAGAQTKPGEGSYDFVDCLRKSLNNEYEIQYPVIDDPEAPSYAMWQSMLRQELANRSEAVVLIGHSLGGSMLLKFLSEEAVATPIKALFLVAIPFWGKDGWDVKEFALRHNFQHFLPDIPAIHLFHCKDDPIVDSNHMALYKKTIPNAVEHEMSGNDHAFAKGFNDIIQVLGE